MTQPVPPFFLLGSVRSGTTLVRLLLGHHPRICRCEEFDFSVESLGHSLRASRREFYDRLRLHRGFRQSGYEMDPTLDPVEALRGLIETRRREDGRPVVGAVVHSSFHLLDAIWPEARYVFLRRDPRDVARSIVGMGWAGNAWHGTRRWVHAEREWRLLCDTVPPERRMEFAFEDLVEDPEGTLERLCGFLGVEFDPEMLEIERDTTYERPRKGGASSWRQTASESEVRLAEAGCGPLLTEAGYEPSSGELPRRLGWLERSRLTLQDRLYRMRFAIRRFGVPLWLEGVVSRRLPFANWRERVELRAQDVMNRHVK